MRVISIPNPTLSIEYRTYLAGQYSSGQTSLDVLSNVSFAANDFVVIGEVGEELTELEQIASLTGKNTIDITGLNFEHPKDTPITKSNWDQFSLEYRFATTDAWSLLTTSSLQWDKLNSIYHHDAGTNTTEYRFRFYNSSSLEYSEYSPTVTGLGFTRQQVGYMIREVRKITNDLDGRVAGDRAIMRFFNKAQDIIRGAKSDWEFLKVTDTSVTTVASQKKYALPDSIGNTGNVSDIRFNYNDGSTNIIYPLKFLSEKEFDLYDRDQDRTEDDYAAVYTFAEADDSSSTGYIRVNPIPKTTGYGTFHIRINRDMTDLDTVDDSTLVPIPSLLEDFAIAQMEKINGNEAKSQLYENLFYGRRQVGQRVVNADTGIALLIKLDNARKTASGQPMSLWNFKGQKPLKTFYNNRFVSNDWIKETYF